MLVIVLFRSLDLSSLLVKKKDDDDDERRKNDMQTCRQNCVREREREREMGVKPIRSRYDHRSMGSG